MTICTSNRRFKRTGFDHDFVEPWAWGRLPLRRDPVEIVSFPIPAGQDGVIDQYATIMVRMKVGDPNTLAEIPLRFVACFNRNRHSDWRRPKRFDPSNPTAFTFTDEEERHVYRR